MSRRGRSLRELGCEGQQLSRGRACSPVIPGRLTYVLKLGMEQDNSTLWARDSLAMFAEFGMRVVWVESSVLADQLCRSGSQACDSAWDC